ncbi:MAG: GNAT family N-acetyltransferase [Planctomycetota bacterium]
MESPDLLMASEVARLEQARLVEDMLGIIDDVVPIAGGVMCRGEPGQWCNQGIGLGMHGPVSGDDIDRLVAFYESKGIQPQFELCPFADTSLLMGLGERGFVIREFENTWYRPTPAGLTPEDVLLNAWPTGNDGEPMRVEVVQPGDETLLRTAVEVSMAGFVPEGYDFGESEMAIHRKMVEMPFCRKIVAWMDGEVIASGGMKSRPPLGAMFGVTVREPWRNRGVQQALMAWRLATAADDGCRTVVIHGTPGEPTERNAQRMGFRLAYTTPIVVRPGDGLVASV